MDTIVRSNYKNTVTDDLLELFVGPVISYGTYRDVYTFRPSPTEYVIKIQRNSGSLRFDNVIEWDIWNEFKDHKFGKYLAPIETISENGHVLIMRKTKPLLKSLDKYKLPTLLSDLKEENFGLYNDKIVCHDYANHALYDVAGKAMKIESVEKDRNEEIHYEFKKQL